jgi:hypothetical protein
MLRFIGWLAVGGPGPVLDLRWDPAPLLFGALLVVLVRWVRLPLRLGTLLLVAGVGGVTLDVVSDAVGVSVATTCAVVVLVFAVVAAKRTRTV